jgi:hypothetical protein
MEVLAMTRLLAQAVEKMRFLPDAMQDELAHVLLQNVAWSMPISAAASSSSGSHGQGKGGGVASGI